MENTHFIDFLQTYGWAVLVVLAAIGALAYFWGDSDNYSCNHISYTSPEIDATICHHGSYSDCGMWLDKCDNKKEYRCVQNVQVYNPPC